MAGMSNKETVIVLKSLEEQGCRLEKTKSGNRVFFPDGSTTSIHWTTSDHRSTNNTRAEVLRAGLTWPFDGEVLQRKSRTKVDQSRQKVVDTIAGMEGPFSTAAVAATSGVASATVSRVVRELGYKSVSTGFQKPWVWVPNPNPVPAGPLVSVSAGGSSVALAQVVEPEPAELEVPPMPGYPEITRASEIMARRAAEAAEKAAAEESALKLAVEPEREFIDSVDSWTIDVPEELLKLATQLRMNIEVRVWRQ